jgi:cation diffusion facilitator family transporter
MTTFLTVARRANGSSRPIADISAHGHLRPVSDSCCSTKGQELELLAQRADQRRVLLIVLAINAVMFFVEFGAGIIAGSTALMADATDMLGDALVYGVSLYALARNERWKAGAAIFKGAFILLLGVGIVLNVVVKVRSGVPPSSNLMLAFGALALVANLACLRLLWRFRSVDVNMSSTFECSRNDVVSNVAVLVAAGAVAAFASPWPDILIGSAMALLFLRSSVRVLLEAAPQLRAA